MATGNNHQSQTIKRQLASVRLPFSFASLKKKFSWLNRQTAITLAVVLASLGGVVYFNNDMNQSPNLQPIAAENVPAPSGNQSSSSNAKVLPKSEPTQLKIDKIGMDRKLSSTAKNADGTIAVPKDPEVPGWYKLGPTPGELGPSVIVGHVDTYKGPAVFWRLRELVPGDTVEITRADNTTAKFKVDAVKQFSQSDFPTKEVYGNIDHAGIRLITCGGVYDRHSDRYSHNTVVYGSLI